MYNILILGSGGREHTLAWKVKQSNKCGNLFIAPGNAGTKSLGQNIDLDILDFPAIQTCVEQFNIDILIVGPEAPLVKGVFDFFINHKVHVIGPSQLSSQLEGSKDFANKFMSEFDIPTAGYITIQSSNIEEGYSYIDQQNDNIVLKADGLAAGKGVLIIEDKHEAKIALKTMLEGQFGNASEKVVIEEFLDGIEFSVFVLTDGKSYKVLPIAKDYKRIGEGDTGLNTGGMGAVSPVPFVDESLMEKVISKIVEPTIQGLQKRDYKYHGFIFLGLIVVRDEPYVIEYNCRLGDPETEVVLPRIKNDLVDIFEALINGNLNEVDIKIDNRSAATIMLVSGGYPEKYEKNKEIKILDSENDSILFHAGTKYGNGKLLTNGGRVIAVTSMANHLQDALNQSLNTIDDIKFENQNYRKDIGFDL